MITTNIRNIVFDLGGVILNLDFNKTSESFKKLGLENFDEIYGKYKQLNLFDDFEIGKIAANDFRNQIMNFLPKECKPSDIDKAWNAMLLDFPEERKNLLLKLKSKYRIFLLSNTNEIHYNSLIKSLNVNSDEPIFGQIFEKEYYSHRIGKRKPHKETFEWVLNENNLLPEETLFLDDTLHHIEGAKLAGINTQIITKDIGILELFKEK